MRRGPGSPISIAEAIADRNLLGAAIGDADSWRGWMAILKAAFGRPLTESEAAVFAEVSGGRPVPASRVQELWAIVGRRGGKSRMAAAVATFIAAFEDHRGKLAPGETGHVLVLAASKSQAKAVHNYVLGFFESSKILKQMLVSTTGDEIRLTGNIVIGVHPANFRTIRGRTLLAVVFDEASFWRDETSASPDIEVYRAVLPALATTGGMLIGISSPYRRVGLLHQKHRDYFGKDGETLVIQASTVTLNPTINLGVIARARADDPESAQSEWDAEFRSDLSALLDDAVIDAAIDYGRPLELPPRPGITYSAFVDASAGRHDAFCVCIGHKEEGIRFVADVVRGWKPPFDPNVVAEEIAALVKDYRCHKVVGDNYAAGWVQQAFIDNGLGYERAELVKSQLYLEGLAPWMRGCVSMPDLPQLIRELRLLERRTHRSGKDTVDHGSGGSDDYANVLFGAIYYVVGRRVGYDLLASL